MAEAVYDSEDDFKHGNENLQGSTIFKEH